ncbi:hypothetical protein AMTR_s00024p00229630 [Amborella trichopoda]|uniref:Uncharacterized protein n=1 Tax=Amborella trichopoda TaxID=13333 RepID=W1PMK7_AMBTC|nr:hypothetical protein AMTR_s00024p00229630 [Amborella trichopoda]
MWRTNTRYGSMSTLARRFEMLVRADRGFEVAAKRRFSLVCFRLVSGGLELNAALLEVVNAIGSAYMTYYS